MTLILETVNVLRMTRTRDAGGGSTNVPAPVFGLQGLSATRNFYSKVSNQRLEEGTHNTQGPGVATATLMFFTFSRPAPYTDPFPAILINDLIQAADGSLWIVHFLRGYEETLQVDCEAIQR